MWQNCAGFLVNLVQCLFCHREEAPNETDLVEEAWDVFLSHTGKQKSFTKIIFRDMVQARIRTFFDERCIRRGDRISVTIRRALNSCKLGLVVVSEDYVQKKWPMTELEHLVYDMTSEEVRKRELPVFPLFHGLSPGDLNNQDNIRKWEKKWIKLHEESSAQREIQEIPFCIDRWPDALNTLKDYAGEKVPNHIVWCSISLWTSPFIRDCVVPDIDRRVNARRVTAVVPDISRRVTARRDTDYRQIAPAW